MPDEPRHIVLNRVGVGTDIHRLVSGRRLMLGGVHVPYDLGLAGHSDADVVLHAVTDAILGAAGLPDIGELFPDTDPAWKDADSRALLQAALSRVQQAGYAVACADVVIHAERPRLTLHKPEIRRSLAKLLGLSEVAVSIKAKTNEGLDAIGRSEAIACTAVAGLCAAV